MTKADVTPEVKETVTALLVKMTYARLMREEVDRIEREVLQTITLYNDLDLELLGQRGHPIERKRTLDPHQAYQSQDDQALAAYYTLCDSAERDAGIKPPGMDKDHCPALVAEEAQRKAELAVMDASAKMLQLDFDGQELNHRLMCDPKGKGLERRREWLDLVIGLVVNL